MSTDPDETRMTCLKMAVEVARQTPGTDVVALAEKFLGFLRSAPMETAIINPSEEQKPKRFAQYREIIDEVAARRGLSASEILGDGRASHICAARHEAIREVYTRHPTLSTPTLGKIFNRDHASIMYALKKTADAADGGDTVVPFPEPKPIKIGSVSIIPSAYTVASFCDAYGIRRNLAYDEMKAGRLEYRKAGRKTLIRKIDADKWLEQLATRTSA